MITSQLRQLFNKSLKKIFQARKLPMLSIYCYQLLNGNSKRIKLFYDLPYIIDEFNLLLTPIIFYPLRYIFSGIKTAVV